jgi:AcrR family transcriptional regulator
MSAATGRMKRSKDTGPDPQMTRTAILHAALSTFLENGYDKVSMDMLAAASGVARRTLYNQFPEGKEAVFFAATEQFWKGFPVFAWSDIESADLAADLTRAATAITDFWKQDQAVAYLRLAIAELHRFPGLMRFAGSPGTLPMMEQLMQYLQTQARKKKLKIPSAELAMRQFFGLVCEPLLWPYVVGLETQRTAQYRREVIESAVAMFLKNYATTGFELSSVKI